MGKSNRGNKTRARRTAVQVLYSGELTEQSPTAILDNRMALADEDGLVNQFTRSIVMGVESHAASIDRYIEQASENWTVDRMPIVDRCILRAGVFEMAFSDETPVAVAINEAVDMAKAFGGEDESARFVNGVLGRIAKRLEDEAQAADAVGAAEASPEDPEAFEAAEVPEDPEAVNAAKALVAEADAEPDADAPAAEAIEEPAVETQEAPDGE